MGDTPKGALFEWVLRRTRRILPWRGIILQLGPENVGEYGADGRNSRTCRKPPPRAKTTEQESTNRQGEHEHDNGSVVAGHGDSFLVCARGRCMIGVTSDGTRHHAAPIALAATSVPSHISARLNTRPYPSPGCAGFANNAAFGVLPAPRGWVIGPKIYYRSNYLDYFAGLLQVHFQASPECHNVWVVERILPEYLGWY